MHDANPSFHALFAGFFLIHVSTLDRESTLKTIFRNFRQVEFTP
jgi:hypothetical protein